MTEWYEHERIEEIDNFVEKHLTNQENEDYLATFTNEYVDWKPEIERWLEDKISTLQTIQELVDDLPNTLTQSVKGENQDE